MSKQARPARQRNYTIDLLRVIAAILMTTFHWLWLAMYPGLGLVQGYLYNGLLRICYRILHDGRFQKAQAKGAFNDKRTHFTHTWRFTAKTYCGYAPLVLFGWTFGWILSNIHGKATFMQWVNTLVWNIFSFLGFHGVGIFQDNATAFVNNYCGPAWYIEAFIVGACIFYAILVASERVAVFVVCPLMFMMSNIWLNVWLDPVTGAQLRSGITALLPQDFVRLWGPLALGIWGWYLANAIRKAKLSKAQETGLGIAWLVALVYALITSWTGYLGGMIHQDIVWMFIALVAICLKDPITRGINNVLQNFPLSKLFADFSGGLYLVHVPILVNYQADIVGAFGWPKGSIVYELCCVAGALLFMLCNKFILKPVYGKLSQILHARDKVEPQIFGEVEA